MESAMLVRSPDNTTSPRLTDTVMPSPRKHAAVNTGWSHAQPELLGAPLELTALLRLVSYLEHNWVDHASRFGTTVASTALEEVCVTPTVLLVTGPLLRKLERRMPCSEATIVLHD